MNDKKLKDYFEDTVSCALRDFEYIEDNPEARNKFVEGVATKLHNQSCFYGWEFVNTNYIDYVTTKRKRKRDRINEKERRNFMESVAISLDKCSSEYQLRLVKRRKIDEALKKISLDSTFYTVVPAKKELPNNIEEMPTNDENEIEPWDYMKTYEPNDSSLLSLANAPFKEVLYFLIRNCYSTKEMKEEIDKISKCGLVDEEITGSVGSLLKDIVEMEEERDNLTKEMMKEMVVDGKMKDENLQLLIKKISQKSED